MNDQINHFAYLEEQLWSGEFSRQQELMEIQYVDGGRRDWGAGDIVVISVLVRWRVVESRV